jgi:hypothetical protein
MNYKLQDKRSNGPLNNRVEPSRTAQRLPALNDRRERGWDSVPLSLLQVINLQQWDSSKM